MEGNVTEFLEVYFDLRKESFKPFPVPVYINTKSNHKKKLPKLIGKIVSNLSCSRKLLRMNENPIWLLYIKQDTQRSLNSTHLIKTVIERKLDQDKLFSSILLLVKQ